MSNALKNFAAERKAPANVTVRTRQDEVKNNTGGFTFKVSDKSRLERFLILGVDGGTFYVKERKLTRQNATFVTGLIRKNESLVRAVLADVAENNRAPKNGPSLFVLALLLVEGQDKAGARSLVSKVARTATHLFELAQYLDDLGGWGRAKRKAVAGWYESKDADALAYQAVKYRQRNGWTHRDLFRLSHPVGVDQTVGNYILGKEVVVGDGGIISGFAEMQAAGTVNQVLAVLDRHPNLPWETIPTQFLTEPKVWKKLFYNGSLGQTALLRNITRFAKIGAFNDLKFAGDVAQALQDSERIHKGRVHPVAYANALGIYQNGQVVNGSWSVSRRKDWTINAKVLGGLEAGFYNSFGAVEPTNKATMVSVDVSASMTWAGPAGLVGMDAREAAALMAMVFVRTEPYVEVNAFSDTLRDVGVSDTDSLATVVAKINRQRASYTNIGLPMVEAKKRKIDVDTFIAITDNEVNYGLKPADTIRDYRRASGIPARFAVIGMTATNFTVADPNDVGQMDFVGFDAAAPRVLSDFSAGRF